MAPALVSVIRNGACLEAYIRSALKNRLQAPRVVQPCGLTDLAGHRERILHGVVRVPGGHVESPGEVGVVDGRPVVGDAGRHELVVPGVLAGDAGLPGDELGGQLGLEGSPGQVILRLPVAVRSSTGRPRCSACATSTRNPHASLRVSTSP